ncbi:hypothetical protein B0H14DRAFT_3608644 [Mycena olivaceomarginata]|nr:hypothetical protein B0H14DRAFT_3608644 [Mycena olivaceomarginata]
MSNAPSSPHQDPSLTQNFRCSVTNFMGKKICLDAQAKKSKNPLKDGKLSGLLHPKAPAVPSTVTAPAAIQMVIAPNTPILGHLPPPTARVSTQLLDSEAPQSLLDQLRAAIRMLPVTVPEATELNVLAAFARDPSQYVDSEIPAIEVYEQLNPIFHAALGWNINGAGYSSSVETRKVGTGWTPSVHDVLCASTWLMLPRTPTQSGEVDSQVDD